MRTSARCGVLIALLCPALCRAARAEGPPPATVAGPLDVVAGRAVAPVHAVANPEQSYALYVPSTYSPDRRWPIVYVFDPGAQGMRPLQLMKDAAERRGYVVAASNNSRNGPWRVSQEAAAGMWDDTHRRLAIDDRRVYFAGFSGGARVSAALAQACRCARGVFLVGAGFNAGASPSRDTAFSVVSLAGRGDFNYGELVELDAELERLGLRHALRRFDGDHAWAPAAEWDAVLSWAALSEMKDGLRVRDEAFVSSELSKAMERGGSGERAGEPLVALAEYRSAAAVLVGLADTAALSARIEALQKDPALRSAVEREQADVAKQRSLEADILGLLNALREAGGERVTLQAEAALRIRRLRADLQAESRPERRRVLQRALGSVFVSSMQDGAAGLDGGGPRNAASAFELAAEARPDVPGPHLALARCHAAAGDRKAALRALNRAVATGLSARRLAAAVETDERLKPLLRSGDYQRLLASAPVEEPGP